VATIVFFHLHTQGAWKQISRELMTMVQFSGLYGRVAAIRVGVSGPEAHAGAEEIRAFGAKVEVMRVETHDTSAERLTLAEIPARVEENDKVLYLHAKGLKGDANTGWWRYLMAYHLVARHAECLDLLDRVDVVGCNYGRKPRDHFSGNFWWATGRYLRTLGPIPGGYVGPEMWLFTGQPRHAVMYQTDENLYDTPFPPSRYL
jgi:hypothetical protein